jgi:hypothetical protein
VIVIVAVLSVVATVLAGHATAGHTGAGLGLGTGLLIAAALFFAGMAALYVAQGMVMAAAPAVLEDRPPDLAAAFRITLARLPDLGVAGVADASRSRSCRCPVLRADRLPLLLLLLGYFLMYVPAAVVVGNEGGVAAIQTSFRIATHADRRERIGWLGMFSRSSRAPSRTRSRSTSRSSTCSPAFADRRLHLGVLSTLERAILPYAARRRRAARDAKPATVARAGCSAIWRAAEHHSVIRRCRRGRTAGGRAYTCPPETPIHRL